MIDACTTAPTALYERVLSSRKRANEDLSYLELTGTATQVTGPRVIDTELSNDTAPDPRRGGATSDVTTSVPFGETENAVDSVHWARGYNRAAVLKTLVALARTHEESEDPIFPEALVVAARLLDGAAAAHKMSALWTDPLVTRSPHGEVVLEWWHGENKLTTYLSGQTVEYVKVWGSDMVSEMSEGSIQGSADLVLHLRWLMNTP